VIGFVSDKDIDHILDMMPSDAVYYFTQPSIPRALSKEHLIQKAAAKGLNGAAYPTVEEAYHAALRDSAPDDMLYVGGSTFIVADLLATIKVES
jgi:dihydrofolate synthase/folylpolyglutamate synthase